MPFFIPVSVKIAVGIGALTGATIAMVNNKEKMLEVAEQILRKSADFCKEKLDETKSKKVYFAAAHEDHSFSGVASGYNGGKSGASDSEMDEVTTPEISDVEDLDLDLESLD